MAADRPVPLDDAEAAGVFHSLDDEAAVAIAVSGGPDSLALAALMARWRRRLHRPPKLHALVVDHGLRPESASEARHTAGVLKDIGLEATVLMLSGLPTTNLHAAARIARYDAMTDWMALNGFGALATAHHRDDQLETIVMRLARDAEAGIAGIPATGWWADRRLVRPFLDVPKSRLTATVRLFGLHPVIDPSNDDPRFERARIRHAIAGGNLPLPVSELLARAQVGAKSQDELDAAAWSLGKEALLLTPQGAALLDVDSFMKADIHVRRWLLRSVARDMGGNTVPPARDKLARLEARIGEFASRDRSAGFAGATLAGVRFQCAIGAARQKMIAVFRERGRCPAEPMTLKPGAAGLLDRRFRVITSYEREEDGVRAVAGQNIAHGGAGDLSSAFPAPAAASVPFVFKGEMPLFPLVSQDSRAYGITARWCGLRFGSLRLEAPC